jgi:CRISPR type III-A-associated protein Csm2
MANVSEGPPGARKCPSCGKTFVPREAHHRTCFDCFKKQRDAGGGPGGEARAPAARAGAADDYLAAGYFADPGRGVLFPELLTTVAEQWARELAGADVSMGQVRRYFTMARSLEDRLDNNESYDLVANELRRMKANVAALVGRTQDPFQRERLTRTLKAFLDLNVEAAVRDRQSFLKGFLPHFECVLAYFYWFNSQKGGRRRGA